MHYTDPNWYNSHGSAWDHEASFGGHKDDDVDRSAGFHNYAVEWDESTLSFYFDDKKFASYNRPTEIKQLSAQYIIVNLAIGGWAGDDIAITADKPAYFEADWVRVWQAKPAKPDTVRIFSMNFGTCMVRTAEDKLALGDCNSDAAVVTITPLSSTTYRFGFGDLSIDTPNESTEAGITMGLYKWNGGGHQKVVMEKQSGYEGSVVRMKMLHSGLYLRATTDGERVVQSWADDWEWNQMWRLLGKDDVVPSKDTTKKDSSVTDSGRTAIPYLGNYASVYGTSVHYANDMLFVELASDLKNGATVRILDLQGREVMRYKAFRTAAMNVRNLPAGVYHVAVTDEKHSELKRITK